MLSVQMTCVLCLWHVALVVTRSNCDCLVTVATAFDMMLLLHVCDKRQRLLDKAVVQPPQLMYHTAFLVSHWLFATTQ